MRLDCSVVFRLVTCYSLQIVVKYADNLSYFNLEFFLLTSRIKIINHFKALK